ncbi:MAG: endonuclease domain-containing protein [Clostridia bacterium]|nr:endonuclease domain-containing protein [Clostridia bacterium]
MPKLDYSSSNKERSRTLRKNMTPQERHLWYDFLKTLPVTVKRQQMFGNYIVDFYCPSAKLIVELDGSQHYMPEGKTYDRSRDEYLKSLGLKIIRLSNLEIDREFKTVCEYLWREIGLPV